MKKRGTSPTPPPRPSKKRFRISASRTKSSPTIASLTLTAKARMSDNKLTLKTVCRKVKVRFLYGIPNHRSHCSVRIWMNEIFR